jgi:transitional endoplasmic reticulum ATPase
MLTLLIAFGVVLLLLALSVGRSTRRARKAAEERERLAEEAEQRGDFGAPADSPFGTSSFGGLFGQLLSGGGGWSRSLMYDQATGRWIDVTDGDPSLETDAGDDAERAGESTASARTRRRPPAQPATQANPLSSLFGGGLGGGTGGSGNFEVQSPEDLHDFADVGGMTALKREIADTIGLMLEHPDDASRYGIEWNGVLLHGPPGVGKTFFAEAIAGEYGLQFIHVSTGDLIGGIQGQSAQNIDKAFQTGSQNLPCLLFFDEFDSIAQRRDNSPDQESRRTVNQLLTSLEAHRGERQLLVMAATNSVEHLDPAVIRPGRFDRHIRIDLPDAEARREIFRTELAERPVAPDIEFEELVRRSEGMTPASIEKLVDTAALAVFKKATQTGERLELGEADMVEALARIGGEDRPTVEHWSWDSLILPPSIKSQLQQLQAVIEDPESARRFGVDPPTGLLLAGPPGTGKTTVAKVLAAQANCSFYPVSGADVMSKWVGESEGNIRRLFDRARANRPSIVFIDEIDALAGKRGTVETHDSHVNQLLSEMDGVAGQRGIFVVGATNRPDQLDPAIVRGGRLSRTIVLGLPDAEGRLAMLRLHTARMPTVGVDLEALAERSEGLSPADLKALCQEAALAAMARDGEGDRGTPAVCQKDFDEAIARYGRSRESIASGI